MKLHLPLRRSGKKAAFDKKLYHGSNTKVKKPLVNKSRLPSDMGNGFYTTDDYNYAEYMGERYTAAGEESIINRYTFDEERALKEGVSIKTFEDPMEWTKFVIACRVHNLIPLQWAIIVGESADGVLEDVVKTYCKMRRDGNVDFEKLYRMMETHNTKKQIVFKDQDVLNEYLKYDEDK